MPAPRTATGPGRTRPCSARRWDGCGSRRTLPGTAHEPRLHRRLARLVPDLLPALLAVDEPRAWSLLADAGPTLRAVADPAAQLATWERLLPRYAQAQLAVAAHRDDLLSAGVPERSPASLPGQAAALVAELATLAEDRGGLGPDRRAALEARLPAYGRWCCRPGCLGPPGHDPARRPALGQRVRGRRQRAHPRLGRREPRPPVRHHAGDAELRGAPRRARPPRPARARVRDAYLEPFTAYAERRDLLRLVDRARQAGRVTRALAWRAALAAEPPEAHAEWDFPVRGWLEEILQDSALVSLRLADGEASGRTAGPGGDLALARSGSTARTSIPPYGCRRVAGASGPTRRPAPTARTSCPTARTARPGTAPAR